MYTLRRSRSSASQCPVFLPKKLVVLGDANSGKSCLLLRFCHDTYPEHPTQYSREAPSTLDNYERIVDSQGVRLMLVDANPAYDRLMPLFCQSTDVVIVCFAIDARDSLDNVLHYWKPEVLDKHCGNNVPTILVGNKKDLRDDPSHADTVVSREDALRVAQAIGAVDYLECSAKINDGVREVFDTAAKVVVQALKALKIDRRKSKCRLS